MHVLLIDVDSKIPNIALMKLASFHKDDAVELLRLNYSGYPRKNNLRIDIDAYAYDVVYDSVIFDVNKDIHINGCDIYDIGGTGISLAKCLPEEKDNLVEDYRRCARRLSHLCDR